MLRKSYFILVCLCIFLFTGCPESFIEERALKIHESALTVDTHVDTPLFIYYQDLDLGEYHDPYEITAKSIFPEWNKGGWMPFSLPSGLDRGPGHPKEMRMHGSSS